MEAQRERRREGCTTVVESAVERAAERTLGERRGSEGGSYGRGLGHSGMLHLETRAGGQQVFLFLWIDGERRDVECGLGVKDDERSDAAEL
jgi:hypothetical protein